MEEYEKVKGKGDSQKLRRSKNVHINYMMGTGSIWF